MNPLTHHEILELVGPFTRRGRHVDFAGTDRLRRRVAFRPIDHPESSGCPPLRETLALEDLGGAAYRLTRRLTPAAGPDATLEAEGADATREAEGAVPGELLARIDAVPPQRQFRVADGGVLIAVSFRLLTVARSASAELSASARGPGSASTSGADSAGMILTRGVAQVVGLDVTLDAASARRGPAAVAVTRRAPGDALRLPEDALAVLGGQWSRLRETTDGWAAELQLRAREPQRSRDAEAALDTAARHLASMLAEPPYRFHERWIAARWRVFCRRLVPLAACIGLILCAAAVPKLHLAESSGLRMLILNSPPILMMLFFCLREIPVVEFPPLPRRSAAGSWREDRADAASLPPTAAPSPAAATPAQG